MNAPEPPPTHNDQPAVWDLVINDVTAKAKGSDLGNVIIADMQERNAFGIAKYSTPLQAFNGRDPLRDAYQEALDLTVYLRQRLIEQDDDLFARALYRQAVGLVFDLRHAIGRKPR